MEYANNHIHISNKTFTKWRKLKCLKLVNNDAVVSLVCYFFSAVEGSNERLECEKLVLDNFDTLFH